MTELELPSDSHLDTETQDTLQYPFPPQPRTSYGSRNLQQPDPQKEDPVDYPLVPEKNHVVPTAWQDEALARDGVSGELERQAEFHSSTQDEA